MRDTAGDGAQLALLVSAGLVCGTCGGGPQWETVELDTTVQGVWGYGSEIWVAGRGSTAPSSDRPRVIVTDAPALPLRIFRGDGETFSEVTGHPIQGSEAAGVPDLALTGSLDGAVWVAGYFSTDAGWQPFPEGFTPMWGAAVDDVWGRYDHELAHWNGTSVEQVTATLGAFLPYAIGGSGPADIWVTAGAGVFQWDGGVWTLHDVEEPIYSNVASAWAFSNSDVWLGGGNGVLHWDGAAWSEHVLSDEAPQTLSGSAAILWADGVDYPDVPVLDENQAVIFRHAAGAWEGYSLEGEPSVRDLWAQSAERVWVAGSSGRLYRLTVTP